MVEYAWCSKDSPAKMFRQDVKSYEKFHPTTKPTNLMEWCIEMFPNCSSVFDGFMGSGSTGVACRNLDINFIGVEKDLDYFNIAKSRINSEKSTPLF